MEEEELIKKLKNIDLDDVNPTNKTNLSRMLADAAELDSFRTRKTSFNLSGLFNTRMRTWQTVLASTLVIAIVAGLAVGLPMLAGKDNEMLASDIALNDPQVKAALGGVIPVKMAVTDNFNSTGISRVVMAIPPTEAVVADVDMKTGQVTSVNVQIEANITEEQVLEIARSDQRVRDALNQGFIFHFDRIVELYTEPPEEILEPYGYFVSNPSDMVGFLGFLSMEDSAGTYFCSLVVNISLEKIVVFIEAGQHIIITKATLNTDYVPRFVFVEPDPGSINGEEPESFAFYPLEFSASRIVIGQIEKGTNRQYATYTWNVTQKDIEGGVELAKSDSEVRALLAKGAKIVGFKPGYSSGGFDDSICGLMWNAEVRIDLGEISYTLLVDLSSKQIVAGGLRSSLKPLEPDPYEIILP